MGITIILFISNIHPIKKRLKNASSVQSIRCKLFCKYCQDS